MGARGKRRVAIDRIGKVDSGLCDAIFAVALSKTREQSPDAEWPEVRDVHRAADHLASRKEESNWLDIPRTQSEVDLDEIPTGELGAAAACAGVEEDVAAEIHAMHQQGAAIVREEVKQLGSEEILDWYIRTRVHDVPLEDLARELDIPANTLSRRLKRIEAKARERLRRRFGPAAFGLALWAMLASAWKHLTKTRGARWATGGTVALVVAGLFVARDDPTPQPPSPAIAAFAEWDAPPLPTSRLPATLEPTAGLRSSALAPPEDDPWVTARSLLKAPEIPPTQAPTPESEDAEPPEDAVDQVCAAEADPSGRGASRSRGEPLVLRGQLALALARADPPTRRELALAAELGQHPSGAWTYADIPPPAPAAVDTYASALASARHDASRCREAVTAAIYVVSVRRALRGQDGGCYARQRERCEVQPAAPLNHAELVMVACRLLLDSSIDDDGRAEELSACQPPFEQVHPALVGTQWYPAPGGPPDWYASPPGVLVSYLEHSGGDAAGLTAWLQAKTPATPVRQIDVQSLLSLLGLARVSEASSAQGIRLMEATR